MLFFNSFVFVENQIKAADLVIALAGITNIDCYNYKVYQ